MTPDKIRSVQLIDSYFPQVDGVVQTVHNYAIHLNRHSDTLVVAPSCLGQFDDGTLPYEVFRTKILPSRISEYPVAAPAFDKALKDRLKKDKPDILHVHSPFFMGRFATSFARKLGVPCVTTFHSKYYDDALNITGSKFAASFVRQFVVEHYRHADAVWSCSEGTAQTLRSYGYQGEIFVIDNGTTMQFPPSQREELRRRAIEKLSLPQGKKTLLFVGHLIRHKNLMLILDTFRLLCNDSDDYRLLIAGEGYDSEKIRTYADSLGFSDGQVSFLGKLEDRETLAGLYASADLFFFPSVYDNSPLVVREAAAMGLPSLLTEGSNASEAVVKDVSGFTAKESKEAMYEEIKRIFASDALRASVAEKAEQTVPKSFEKITETVREQYAQILERYQSARRK